MDNFHLGHLISQKMEEARMSNSELARTLGVTAPAVTYILRKNTMDVYMLQRVSNALKYNFFRHFSVEGDNSGFGSGGNESKKLKEDLEKCKREMELQKVEIQYLKKINELLERK